ncbi:response regulator [Rhodobacterales bacterium HKCCE2091]|nr:response regulator [Rhodobacterales bacterium HKCCE2091]
MTDTALRDPELLNIILVDDDLADVKALTRSLRKAGIANSVIRARDGVEALAILRKSDVELPDRYILLIDVNMPRMNGLELLSEIRSDARLSKAVVFVLSTSGDDRDVAAAYELNAAGYIRKDRAGEDFAELITTLRGLWRTADLPDMSI